jgi:hypothetical protein
MRFEEACICSLKRIVLLRAFLDAIDNHSRCGRTAEHLVLYHEATSVEQLERYLQLVGLTYIL